MSTITGNIGLGTSQTSGLWTAGGPSSTGTMTLGQSTATQTTNIQTGANASGTTKTINFGTNGLTGSNTLISMGSNVSGSISTTTIYGQHVLTPGNISVNAWTTNGVGLVQSSATYTDLTSSGTVAATYVNLFGAPTVAATNTTTYTEAYNTYFKSPVAGTNTVITTAYALGVDSLLVNGTLGVPLAGSGLSFSIGGSQSSSSILIGGAAQSGQLTFGRSTVSQTTNIQASANTSGTTKTINFGTAGLTGSNTLLNLGPVLGTGTVTVNAGTIVTIANTASSNNTTTGALIVAGGVGIQGNLNVGGSITATNIYIGPWPVSTGSSGGGLSSVAIQYNGSSIGSATTINFATGTTATVAGSVVTVQATAVAGGTSSTATTATNLANGATGSIPYQTANGLTSFIGIGSTGTVLQSNGTSATWVTTSSLGISGGGSSAAVSYQTTASIVSNVLTLNLTTSTLFNVNVTQAITSITITNVAATGTISSFILALNNQGTVYSIIWPNTFRWPGGTAPTLTGTLNKKDVIVSYTDDGGVNWYAFVSGYNL